MKKKVKVELPIRINFGGAWSDTPPFCVDEGGCVCNASVTINNKKPIKVIVKKIKKNKIIIQNGKTKIKINNIQDLRNIENDILGERENKFLLEKLTLDFINLKNMGFKININNNIPKGSGLGASSILILAILKAMYKYQNKEVTSQEIICQVLEIEKRLGTGGGWQDQAGVIENGIKLLKSKPGNLQKVEIEKIKISKKTKKELRKRFALIYTGKTRESAKIVNEIMEEYKNGNVDIKNKIILLKNIALEMKESLENDKVDKFAELLNENYEISKLLNNKIENENTKRIFEKINGLIAGKMICGAGNGGFIEVILNQGIRKKTLAMELKKNFPNTLIKIWEVEFY